MSLQSETQKRLPVWTVLSELFLDTSLDERDYDRIAEVLSRSAFSRAEIERILRDEVSPAFVRNLFSVAGEWQPWSEDEVHAIMERSLEQQSSKGWRAWIKRRMALRMIPSEWHLIAARLE